MKLRIESAVMCPWHKGIINLKACRGNFKGKGTIKACPYFKGEQKARHLSSKLIEIYEEIDCSYYGEKEKR